MSEERQETVADIVAEMRSDIANGTVGIWADFGGEVARGYADRIEAAYKECADEYKSKLNREVEELRKENTRLRAALKPVLEVYISQDDPSVDVYDSRLDSAFALKSVREAKRIYKEQCDERKVEHICD